MNQNSNMGFSPEFFDLAMHPVKFRAFLLKNLPAAYFSGVRVQELSAGKAIVTIPFKWFTKNPFRSTYFACLSMAAEMSTGILSMAYVYKKKPKISLLVVSIEGKFYKKAVSKTVFICEEGISISQVVEDAISTGEPQSIRVHSSGFNEKNELVAEFWITWSFKAV